MSWNDFFQFIIAVTNVLLAFAALHDNRHNRK